jgi:4-amino-4-deoxy-L-arabinose transferase-like glycosyltransferase
VILSVRSIPPKKQSSAFAKDEAKGFFALFGLSFLGILFLFVSTKSWGIGVSTDSVHYLTAARHLMTGKGLSLFQGSEIVAMTQWPPLFSILLAIQGMLGMDLLSGARALNIFLFGASILLAGTMVRSHPGTLWTAVLASFMMLTSTTLLGVHSMAWSEPLFIFFGFLGLFLLELYLSRDSKAWLLAASAGSIALAFLARYAGASLVATGIIGIFLFHRGSNTRKILDCILFAAVSCFFMGIWLFRNLQAAHNLWNREFSFHPMILDFGGETLLHLSRWFLPSRWVPSIVGGTVSLLIIAALSAAMIVFERKQRQKRQGATDLDSSKPSLMPVFIFCYLLVLFIHMTFFASHFHVDDRILSPVFVALLILILSVIAKFWHVIEKQRTVRMAFMGLLALYVFAYSAKAIRWGFQIYQEGQEYASKEWRESELIRKVKDFPPETLIYTNAPDAVYFFTGRFSSYPPGKRRWNKLTEKLEDRGDDLLKFAAMKERLKEEKGVVVYFHKIKRMKYPSEDELVEKLDLRRTVRVADGAIYKVKE